MPNDTPKTLCYAGTLFDSDKHLLIESLTLLKTRNSVHFPQTVLIGEHGVAESIRQQLSITVTGRLATLDEVYQQFFAADFALLPMRVSQANKARWPSKITDYWAAGLPVIATPVSDFEELFFKHNLGILANSDSVDAYSAALQTALEMPEAERTRLSKSARKFAETELDWEVLAKRLIKLYQKTIEDTKHRL